MTGKGTKNTSLSFRLTRKELFSRLEEEAMARPCMDDLSLGEDEGREKKRIKGIRISPKIVSKEACRHAWLIFAATTGTRSDELLGFR